MSAAATSNPNDDVSTQIEAAKKIPLPHTASSNEVAQFEYILNGIREMRSLASKEFARTYSAAQQTIRKQNIEIASLKKENENLMEVFMGSKTNYLAELLAAERQIKELQKNQNDCDRFSRALLSNQEVISKALRSHLGVKAPSAIETNALTPIEMVEHISTSNDIDSAIAIDSAATAAAEPPTEVATTSSEIPATGAANESVEPADDLMETEEPGLLQRFPCNECKKSFRSLAIVYRHRMRVHGDAKGFEKAPKMKKTVKRSSRASVIKKLREKNREIEGQKIVKAVAEFYGRTPKGSERLVKCIFRPGYAKKLAAGKAKN